MRKWISALAVFLLVLTNAISAFAAPASFSAQAVPNYDQRQSYYIDRAEFSLYLARTYETLTQKTLPPSETVYHDVEEWQQDYLGPLTDMGILSGTEDGNFSPTGTVSGQEGAQMICRLIAFCYPEVGAKEDAAVLYLQQRGIWASHASAKQPLTLQQAVTMLEKTIAAAPTFPEVEIPKSGKTVYLTFDDGVSSNTLSILDTLKSYGVPATFFVTGEADPTILKRMAAEGHAIGNHSYSHDYATIYRSKEAFFTDFEKEQQYLESVLGYRPTIVRLPGGSNNTVSKRYGGEYVMQDITAALKAKGYVYTDWNCEGKDATTKGITADEIVANVFESAGEKENVIVLLHQNSGKETTAEALPDIIEGFLAKGYDFAVISEQSYVNQFLK